MSLTVITPAASYDLTTLERVKREFDITGASDDKLLDDMIKEASSLTVSWCNRAFAEERVSEAVMGQDSLVLTVSRTPVTQIHAITCIEDGSSVAATDYLVEDAGAGLIRHRQRPWERSVGQFVGLGGTALAGSAYRNFTVDYTGGYSLPSFAVENPSLPRDLERAVLEIIKGLYTGRQRDPSVKSEDFDGVYRVNYAEATPPTLPPSAAEILRRYRRPAL